MYNLLLYENHMGLILFLGVHMRSEVYIYTVVCLCVCLSVETAGFEAITVVQGKCVVSSFMYAPQYWRSHPFP